MSSIEDRLARNEVMFRAINDRIRDLADRFGSMGHGELDFVCECADETCVERVPLTPSQYDDVRAIPARFVVVPGHEATPLVERVIFRGPNFVIVRKIGIAAEIARELTDPA
ncbi:MAG TPA: hypothetical protein VE982_08075 [Gaiellaceae bacterium]|nr:hypothetical protein [Gaiellaceae bacterium]